MNVGVYRFIECDFSIGCAMACRLIDYVDAGWCA